MLLLAVPLYVKVRRLGARDASSLLREPQRFLELRAWVLETD